MSRTVVVCAALAVACAAMVPIARSASHTLTAAQYRAKATAVCNATIHQLNKLPQPKPKPGQSLDSAFSRLGPYLATGTKLVAQMLRQLEALAPPRALAPLVHRALAILHTQLETFAKLERMAKAGTLTFQKFLGTALLMPDATKLWKRIGVPACAG